MESLGNVSETELFLQILLLTTRYREQLEHTLENCLNKQVTIYTTISIDQSSLR